MRMCERCKKTLSREEAVRCCSCRKSVHLSCHPVGDAVRQTIRDREDWQCPDCVVGEQVCTTCGGADQDKMLLCDLCDRGYHTQCMIPPLAKIPDESWYCAKCSPPHQKSHPKRRSAETSESPVSPSSSRSQLLSPDRKLQKSGSASPPKQFKLSSPELALNKQRVTVNKALCSNETFSSVQVPFEELSTKADLDMFLAAEEAVKQSKSQTVSASASDGNSRKVEYVRFGNVELKSWYPSPYPESLSSLHTIFICEFCLKPMASIGILHRHMMKCVWRHPPGNEIYRKGKLSFWEVDGNNAKVYCQNLCLLAKMFLDHKTLYFDVQPFLFYVLTESDADGCHIVGYFSKEKESVMNCNLSCLLTLPHHQRKGYGQFLIDFSYLLSRVDGRIGSPEHPLSDLGLVAYRYYWTHKILAIIDNIRASERKISIKQMSVDTGIHTNDIVSTLQSLGMIKNYKGTYVVLRKPDVVKDFLKQATKKRKSLGGDADLRLDEKALKWQPMTDYSHDATVIEYLS